MGYGGMATRVFMVERDDSGTTNRHYFKITNSRTGEVKRHYAEEFITGQMHYDPATANYPNYVHDDVWRLCP